MRGWSCVRVGALRGRSAESLREFERLRVEEHLAECDSCGREQTFDAVLGALDDPRPLTDRARTRAIRRALDEPVQAAQLAAPPRARWMWAAASLAAAAAVVAWIALRGDPPGRADDVVIGDDARGHSGLSAGAPVPAGQTLTVTAGAKLRLAHAHVHAISDATLRWDPRESSVELDSGRLAIEVDPSVGAPFRVTTGRFIVQVLGTRFEVDADGAVEVERGAVRVTDRGGALLAELGAGQSWLERDPAEIPELAATGETAEPAPAVADRAGPTRRAAAPASAGALLRSARRQLERGDVAAARKTASRVASASSNRRHVAEARTLLAECALAAGETDRAAALYLEVHEHHPDLPAGDTALFAAARLRRSAALFRRYLEKYPNGRLREEAAGRLRTLREDR